MNAVFNDHVANVIATVGTNSAPARSRIAASWCRSYRTYKLDPSRPQRPDRLSSVEFRHRTDLNDLLLRTAAPVLDHLASVISFSGCAVFMADAQGCILDSRTSQADQIDFEGFNLSPGADWSEAAEGTNGIGTCLSEARAVTIHRTDHFSARNIEMTCLGAPIFGPQGDLAGVVDISSARADQSTGLNCLMAETVAEAARRIEAALFRAEYPDARIVVAPGAAASGAGLLAIDHDDVIIGANRAARRQLGLAKDKPLAPMPAGDVLGHPEARSGFDRAEYSAVKRALLRSNGNASAAARALGIGRATLYRRMNRLGLNASDLDLSHH